MSHILLHRKKDRSKLYSSSPVLVWSEELDCWLTFKPEVIARVLTEPDARVVDYAGELSAVGTRVGYDFSESLFALGHIPLAAEGSTHDALRRQFALRLSASRTATLETFKRSVQNHLRIFDETGETDLSRSFFQPVVSEMMTALSRIGCPHHQDDVGPSQIFDRTLSVNRRKRINQQLGEIRRDGQEGGGADDVGIRIAMRILGGDALLGSFQVSFCRTVKQHPGMRLDEIPWPGEIPCTGVPYIERVAAKKIMISGLCVEQGQRIRVYLDAVQQQDDAGRGLYFGAGHHTCLGKPISNQAWRHLVERFSTLQKRVEIIDVGYKQADYVFNCPNRIRARIHDCQR